MAVKLFEQLDDLLPNTAAELTRSYSDMRFELNKLSTLSHPYIVKFIGVLTNPHSFVLEWAPLKSLEHIRQQHAKEKEPFCPTSVAKVLMQVGHTKSRLWCAVFTLYCWMHNYGVITCITVGHQCSCLLAFTY